MAIRLNGLMKESFAVMTLAANDVESEEVVRKYLYQARVEVTKLQRELYVKGTHKSCLESSTSIGPSSGINDQVLDPIKKKGKQNGYGRLKPRIEQRKKRASQKTLKSRAEEQHEQQFLGISFESYEDQNTSFTQLLTQASTNQFENCIENQSSSITGRKVDINGLET
ncbi:hypothetical protein HAX54_032753 [Datura stramonium]|uniref:Uncharacterized protein n=1 Tax=Datura stramonium TaxID=4076 RepID=A0ABS8VE75_DATST|nr:hypothetical protein [Datura stramonium]